jgi:hypothetical protein
VDDLKDYWSFRILTNYDRKTKILMQTSLINNLKGESENKVNKLSDYVTPGDTYEYVAIFEAIKEISLLLSFERDGG